MRACPVDKVAVQRAIDGDTVVLNRDERITAVHQLTDAGFSQSEISDRLRIHARQVERDRATPLEPIGGGVFADGNSA